MLRPSAEQATIIGYIQQKRNVFVDAVAGSGKSTTVLMTAHACPHLSILQLTYNAMLRKEVQEKLEKEEPRLHNVKVHTFHSLAVHMYDSSAHNDTKLKYVITRDAEPLVPLWGVDLLILDEVQDMTPLYFQFVLKLLRDLVRQEGSRRVQLMILGDTKQSLYEYKGSDVRFLTESAAIWQRCPYVQHPEQFEACTLQTSFRITRPMARFVNEVMLGQPRLHAVKDGPLVKYICGTEEDNHKRVNGRIKTILEDKNVQPDDIFVLTSSIKYVHVRKLENWLVEKGIPCFMAREDEEMLDERVIKGKVVFSSFHSVKGRQRPYVFVLGFDSSSLYKQSMDTCPNTLYVACTRASHELFVLESLRPRNKPLPFLTMGHHEMLKQPYIEFVGEPRSAEYYYRQSATLSPTPSVLLVDEREDKWVRPSELPKHHSNEVYDELFALVQESFQRDEAFVYDKLCVQSIWETDNHRFEDVSDLNGIAIPLLYCQTLPVSEEMIQWYRTLLHRLCDEILENETKPYEYRYLKNQVRFTMPQECRKVEDYLLSANMYVAVKERLYGKFMQIKKYTWLSREDVHLCNQRMSHVVGNDITHIEYNVVSPDAQSLLDEKLQQIVPHLPYRFLFAGRIDATTPTTLWEFKFVSELTTEHFLQVMVYAWLWQQTHRDDPKRFRLFNIRTNDVYELTADALMLDKVMAILLESRYGEKEMPCFDAFLQRCHDDIQHFS